MGFNWKKIAEWTINVPNANYPNFSGLGVTSSYIYTAWRNAASDTHYIYRYSRDSYGSATGLGSVSSSDSYMYFGSDSTSNDVIMTCWTSGSWYARRVTSSGSFQTIFTLSSNAPYSLMFDGSYYWGRSGSNLTRYNTSGSVSATFPFGAGLDLNYYNSTLLMSAYSGKTQLIEKAALSTSVENYDPNKLADFSENAPSGSTSNYATAAYGSSLYTAVQSGGSGTAVTLAKMNTNDPPTTPVITSSIPNTISPALELSWNPSVDPDGIREYVLSAYPNGSDPTSTERVVGKASSSPATFDLGTYPSATYQFRFHAVDSLGATSEKTAFSSQVVSSVVQKPTGVSSGIGLGATSHLAVTSAGTRWMLAEISNAVKFYYSLDGTTWTDSGSGWAEDISNAEIFIDKYDQCHVIYADASNQIRYRRGVLQAGNTAWTWTTNYALGMFSGENYTYPRVVAFPEGSGWVAHGFAYSYNSSTGSSGVTWWRMTGTAPGSTVSVSAGTRLGALSSGSSSSMCAVTFSHTGDGKTPTATPDLHLVLGNGSYAGASSDGYRYMRGDYAAGSWTWGTPVGLDAWLYNRQNENYAPGVTYDSATDTVWAIHNGYRPSNPTDTWKFSFFSVSPTNVVTRYFATIAAEDQTSSYDSQPLFLNGYVYLAGAYYSPSLAGYRSGIYRWKPGMTQAQAIALAMSTGSSNTEIGFSLVSRDRYLETLVRLGSIGVATPSSDWSFLSAEVNVAPTEPTTVTANPTTVLVGDPVTISWQTNDPNTNTPQQRYQLRWRKID